MIVNVPSNFLKSVCEQSLLCATLYQHSSMFRTPCMKYVQTHFLKKIYVCSKYSCVRSSHDLCACAHAHSLEGTLVIVYELLATSFSKPWHMRACGQSSPSPSHLPTDSIWSFICEAWWRIGRDDAFQPEGHGFEYRSSRHVGTLGKSFTYNCL